MSQLSNSFLNRFQTHFFYSLNSVTCSPSVAAAWDGSAHLKGGPLDNLQIVLISFVVQRNELRLISARPNIPETGTGGSGLRRRQIRPAIKLMKSANVDGLESISRLPTDSTPRGCGFPAEEPPRFAGQRTADWMWVDSPQSQTHSRGNERRCRLWGREESPCRSVCLPRALFDLLVYYGPSRGSLPVPLHHQLPTPPPPLHSRCLPILPPPAGRASDHPLHPC